MQGFWWLTPVLALIGALTGAVLTPWVSGAVAERRADRALVREARLAVERWHSTLVGPDITGYPGMSDALVQEIAEAQRKKYFDTHFEYTQQARAALGAVQHLDPRIAEIVVARTWRIPEEKSSDIRSALSDAEKNLMFGKRVKRNH